MQIRGNLPLEQNALLFSISGTGSFICPVTQTRLDIPRLLITQSCTTKADLNSPTCRFTVIHANHQTTMTAPSQRINYTLGPQRGGSVKTAPPSPGSLIIMDFISSYHCPRYWPYEPLFKVWWNQSGFVGFFSETKSKAQPIRNWLTYLCWVDLSINIVHM